MLQVAGRRLLAGDSSSHEQPSNEDLYLQSYRNCEPQRTLLIASLRCISRASMQHTREPLWDRAVCLACAVMLD